MDYLRQLMEHVPVDSFGKCLHNKNESDAPLPAAALRGLRHLGALGRKRRILEGYKFVVAFENSILDDYVTEKFFEAFDSGAVPIYRGAPNIREGGFAPGPGGE